MACGVANSGSRICERLRVCGGWARRWRTEQQTTSKGARGVGNLVVVFSGGEGHRGVPAAVARTEYSSEVDDARRRQVEGVGS
jgi:hypothetical protein